MRYYRHSEEDIKKMLLSIGINSLDDLFAAVPEHLKFKNLSNLDEKGMDEHELKKYMGKKLKGYSRDDMLVFAGAGCYEHVIPSIVDHIASRPEFYTSYTPYQPEASQGTLQIIFEYQTMMCEITKMDISNASHYDGATSLAEAVFMLFKQKKGKIIVSSSLHPNYKNVLKTYLGDSLLPFLFFSTIL